MRVDEESMLIIVLIELFLESTQIIQIFKSVYDIYILSKWCFIFSSPPNWLRRPRGVLKLWLLIVVHHAHSCCGIHHSSPRPRVILNWSLALLAHWNVLAGLATSAFAIVLLLGNDALYFWHFTNVIVSWAIDLASAVIHVLDQILLWKLNSSVSFH